MLNLVYWIRIRIPNADPDPKHCKKLECGVDTVNYRTVGRDEYRLRNFPITRAFHQFDRI